MQAVLQWAHSQPHSALVWYLLATVAMHHAACSLQAGSYCSALTLCKRAQHLQSSSSNAHQHPGSKHANGFVHEQDQQRQQQQHEEEQQLQQRQQHMQAKLQCMISECQLHGRQAGGGNQALSSAKAAVQTASGFRNPELIAVALQQLSR